MNHAELTAEQLKQLAIIREHGFLVQCALYLQRSLIVIDV
jgi:hypothetical protein